MALSKKTPPAMVKLNRYMYSNPLYMGNIELSICLFDRHDPSKDFIIRWPTKHTHDCNSYMPQAFAEMEFISDTKKSFNSAHRACGKPVIARMPEGMFPASGGMSLVVGKLYAFIPQQISDTFYMRRLEDTHKTEELYNYTYLCYEQSLDDGKAPVVINGGIIESVDTDYHKNLNEFMAANTGVMVNANIESARQLHRLIKNKTLLIFMLSKAKELDVVTDEELL